MLVAFLLLSSFFPVIHSFHPGRRVHVGHAIFGKEAGRQILDKYASTHGDTADFYIARACLNIEEVECVFQMVMTSSPFLPPFFPSDRKSPFSTHVLLGDDEERDYLNGYYNFYSGDEREEEEAISSLFVVRHPPGDLVAGKESHLEHCLWMRKDILSKKESLSSFLGWHSSTFLSSLSSGSNLSLGEKRLLASLKENKK
jgi:hypothetical protein